MKTLADAMNKYLSDPSYNLVSMCKGSIPTPGSLCKPLRIFSASRCAEIDITRIISHRNGDRTVVTPIGYFRFWREPEVTP